MKDDDDACKSCVFERYKCPQEEDALPEKDVPMMFCDCWEEDEDADTRTIY